MAVTKSADRVTPHSSAGRAIAGLPADSIHLDWIMALTACAIVFGLYIDGWAHSHSQVDDSFFTPWHALLYGAVALAGLVLIISQFRNVSKGFRWSNALPAGYTLSLIGFFAFGAGGVIDMLWHEAFGFEESVEALISPTHLFLALTGSLIMTGPIRALWRRQSDGGWQNLAPAIFCFICITSVFTFFNAYAPIGGDMIILTGARPDNHKLYDVVGIIPFVIQSNILLGTALFMARRWRLPFGAITLLFFVNSLLMTWYRVGEAGEFIFALSAALVGLLGDYLLSGSRSLETSRLRLAAFLLPFAHSLGAMLVIHILGNSVWGSGGLWWLIHMWLGVPVMAGAFGYGLSMIMRQPALPDSKSN